MKNEGQTPLSYLTSDGYRCHFRYYPPAGEVANSPGHVVFLHGIQSHGGWYTHSCAVLAEAGYAVWFLDRRGSGLNEQNRGDAPGFRRLLDDVAEFITQKLRVSSSQPIWLVTISWGGKLGVALQRRHPGLVDGLVLLCPGFCPQVNLPLARRLHILATRLVTPTRRFPIPLNDPELFTASPRWQQFIREDPLALREASARFLVESVRLDRYVRWSRRHVRNPVLLLLAEKDRIIDNAQTRALVQSFASQDQTVIEYPNAHHTLEFEPDPTRYLTDLLEWLRVQAPDDCG